MIIFLFLFSPTHCAEESTRGIFERTISFPTHLETRKKIAPIKLGMPVKIISQILLPTSADPRPLTWKLIGFKLCDDTEISITLPKDAHQYILIKAPTTADRETFIQKKPE